ncbi:unnamed protein product [Vitrella brassicaformis CCMP3155]|uniref:Uncharacterized protein n=1 Tax=Vitrella brassicaformis (strain CCMP3155) TaxID=1169540 RepID=A0A0G4EQV3_VITBC|nr:unnamed protein product [Vitrella brassicaformis CCMP3155]|eukprot:CEM00618.1 unnamed protein product [Vitrella brassicaformis CCMP3155]
MASLSASSLLRGAGLLIAAAFIGFEMWGGASALDAIAVVLGGPSGKKGLHILNRSQNIIAGDNDVGAVLSGGRHNSHPVAEFFLLVHLALVGLNAVLFPLQFAPFIRRKHIDLHRQIGRVALSTYIVSCLAVLAHHLFRSPASYAFGGASFYYDLVLIAIGPVVSAVQAAWDAARRHDVSTNIGAVMQASLGMIVPILQRFYAPVLTVTGKTLGVFPPVLGQKAMVDCFEAALFVAFWTAIVPFTYFCSLTVPKPATLPRPSPALLSSLALALAAALVCAMTGVASPPAADFSYLAGTSPVDGPVPVWIGMAVLVSSVATVLLLGERIDALNGAIETKSEQTKRRYFFVASLVNGVAVVLFSIGDVYARFRFVTAAAFLCASLVQSCTAAVALMMQPQDKKAGRLMHATVLTNLLASLVFPFCYVSATFVWPPRAFVPVVEWMEFVAFVPVTAVSAVLYVGCYGKGNERVKEVVGSAIAWVNKNLSLP